MQLCKIAAPFTPFLAEEIYRNLRGASMPESVHLCAFPEPNAAARDLALEARMAAVQTVVELGRRRMVGGQEDMIVDVAYQMSREKSGE